jgi:hypothetical protein
MGKHQSVSEWTSFIVRGQYINWFKMIDANTWLAGGDYGVS